MGAANFFGNILGAIGQGVSQLPAIQRQSRLDEEDKRYKAATLALQRQASEQNAQQLEQSLAQQEFNQGFKTFENLPEGTALTPSLAATGEKYGFPMADQMTLPARTATPGVGEFGPQQPTGQKVSVPFEGPSLLREQLRSYTSMNNTNSRLTQNQNQFDQMLAFRKQALAQNLKVAEMVNRARQTGNQMMAERIATDLAQLSFLMDKAEFDQKLDLAQAQSADPLRIIEIMRGMTNQGAITAPPVKYPEPSEFVKPVIRGVPDATAKPDPFKLRQ